jgi:hypothetical protein
VDVSISFEISYQGYAIDNLGKASYGMFKRRLLGVTESTWYRGNFSGSALRFVNIPLKTKADEDPVKVVNIIEDAT